MKRQHRDHDALLEERDSLRAKLAKVESDLQLHPHTLRSKLTAWLAKELVDSGRLTEFKISYDERADTQSVSAGCAEICLTELKVEIAMDGTSCVQIFDGWTDDDWNYDYDLPMEVDLEEDPPDSSRAMWEEVCKACSGNEPKALALAVFWCYRRVWHDEDTNYIPAYYKKEDAVVVAD